MEADLHLHTNRYSGCSNMDPVATLRRAEQVGLDIIALTEHGIRWPDRELEMLMEKSDVQGLMVIPGQEAACYSSSGHFEGEFLVYGYPESLGSSKSAETLIKMVHDQGGVVVAAHPFKISRQTGRFYGSGYLTKALDLDGLEVSHPSYDEESRRLAFETMVQMNIAGLGASDAHDLHQIGIIRTGFDGDVRDVPSLCEEIRAGRVSLIP